MPDIFLSYSREDQARAKVFAEAFEREGLKVWWDVGLTPGEAYDEVTPALPGISRPDTCLHPTHARLLVLQRFHLRRRGRPHRQVRQVASDGSI
ncbi:MAG: TIR domain-containing protein [Hyphomonadaceae bacterium]